MTKPPRKKTMSELMKGNKNAEKYPPERIIEIVYNCMEGLASFKSYDEKQEFTEVQRLEGVPEPQVVRGDKKKRVMSGYSCLKRALISNGIYDESKLHEWLKTHTNEVNKDNEESQFVSQAIKELITLGHQMLEINTMEGHYAPAVGIFFNKAINGYSDGSNIGLGNASFEGFEFVDYDE